MITFYGPESDRKHCLGSRADGLKNPPDSGQFSTIVTIANADETLKMCQ